MVTNYKYGRRKELQIGEFFERRGFAWGRSGGSRGAAEVFASKGRVKIFNQVKATRKREIDFSRLPIDGETALIKVARRKKAIPAVALVAQNYAWIVSVPDRKVLFRGKLKPLGYFYPDER